MNRVIKPNFLLAGGTKCGTTSLYHYFQNHPEIYLSNKIKETNFFIEPKEVLGCGPRYCGKDSYGKSIEDYSKLFTEADLKKHKAIGEICTTYLHFSEYAIPNIQKYLGDPKIIIILRNPIERAYSHHMHNVRDGDENLSFEEALQQEAERIKKNLWLSFRLATLGFYYSDVKAYLDNFSNVKVLLYEKMKESINLFIEEIFEFLEIAKIKIDTRQAYNVSGVPRYKLLHDIVHSKNNFGKNFKKIVRPFVPKRKAKGIKRAISNKNLVKKQLSEETRGVLINVFKSDIEKLSELLNIDLTKYWGIG